MDTVSFKVPIIDNVKTGQNIKELRKAKGMSVKDLKDALGLSSSQAIYKWQWGDALPDIDNLLALSIIFDKDIKDILITQDVF